MRWYQSRTVFWIALLIAGFAAAIDLEDPRTQILEDRYDSAIVAAREMRGELEHLRYQLMGFSFILEKYRDSLRFWRGEAWHWRYQVED